MSLKNDSAMGLGDSIDVIDTDDEVDDTDSGLLNKKQKKTTTKVYRPCPYCLKLQSALTQHLKTVYKNEDEVVRAVLLPGKEKNKAFDLIKKNGILKYNNE